MQEQELLFAVPTYRLRDVGETIEQYDEHFWRNGHSLRMIVFDDSSPANQEKYYPLLERTATHNDLFYVGPAEKEQFLGHLFRRLRDKKLEPLVKNLFRPSYGGNRNYTLMYTLGGLMVSSDDDMRPYTLMAEHSESLAEDEVSHGKLCKAGRNGYTRKSFDIMASFLEVNFRPVVTNKNWRMDCGVAGYDNTFGLPPFFPTRLRFEDYIYRLWVQQEGIVAAHVNAAQHHTKSNYMRNPPAAEIFNEELANLLKRKIKSTITRLDELSIEFDYDGQVSAQDAQEILDKITSLHRRAMTSAESMARPQRAESLRLFAANLERTFYGFEPDFFQQNLLRIVDDVIGTIKGSIELWPTLIEIAYFQKNRLGLPQIRVSNKNK